MAENFGLMDPTYFTSKSSILSWVNNVLKTNYKKIEEFGNSVVYCSLFHMYFPNDLLIKKVIKSPKSINDYYSNFKILQKWFDKLKIKKHIEVQKLVKMKLLDNLEFIQWMKKYFENMGVKNSDLNNLDRTSNININKNKPLNNKVKEDSLVKKIKEIITTKDSNDLKISYIKSLLNINLEDERVELNSDKATIFSTNVKPKFNMDLNEISNIKPNMNSNVKSNFKNNFVQLDNLDSNNENLDQSNNPQVYASNKTNNYIIDFLNN